MADCYKVYYEILNHINLYEKRHMYVSAHSDAETRARDFVKSTYNCDPHITAVYTKKEYDEARWLEFHLQRARTKEPINSKTLLPFVKNF